MAWCGAGFKSRGPHLAGGEKEICKAPLPVAPLQIAQSPAAKMPDQKGSTASALESSRSLIFPSLPYIIIHHFCATCGKGWSLSKLVDVHSVNLGFSRVFEIAHVTYVKHVKMAPPKLHYIKQPRGLLIHGLAFPMMAVQPLHC